MHNFKVSRPAPRKLSCPLVGLCKFYSKTSQFRCEASQKDLVCRVRKTCVFAVYQKKEQHKHFV